MYDLYKQEICLQTDRLSFPFCLPKHSWMNCIKETVCFKPRDKTGKLALSPKQKAIFSRWVRPDEICNSPTMILSVSSFSIKQVGCWSVKWSSDLVPVWRDLVPVWRDLVPVWSDRVPVWSDLVPVWSDHVPLCRLWCLTVPLWRRWPSALPTRGATTRSSSPGISPTLLQLCCLVVNSIHDCFVVS